MSAESSPDSERVGRLDLFSSIPPAQLTHVAGLLEVRAIADGDQVVRQGDEGYAFFVIEAGTAEVSVDDVLVRTLDAGDYFGEIATLRFGRRTATVVATSDMTLFAMSRFNLRLLGAANPTIAETLEVAVRERLATASPKPPTESSGPNGVS
jgi:CRP-like cAMP-binding protein